jgi:NTP pyrophosphatase (non-canonical NTP hydrolase)
MLAGHLIDGWETVNTELEALQGALRAFAREREWEQFHSPKNLSAALLVEAAELLEHFQWMTEEQSRALDERKTAEVAEEIADVFLYLLQLSDKLGIDVIMAARRKLELNAAKYPVELAKGNSKKYSEY